MSRKTDITQYINKKYNKWTVNSYSHHQGKSIYMNCTCDCGTTSKVRLNTITSSITKGCRYCHIKKNKEHPSWKGVGDLSLGFFSTYKFSAAARNIEFSITIEYAWKIYQQQNSKCALTGWQLKFAEKYQDCTQTASLDRIDNSKGYIEGNIQWVHRDINTIKSDWNNTYFIQICHAIAKHTEVDNNPVEWKRCTKHKSFSKE